MEKLYLAALQMVSGIGRARLKALVEFFGSAQLAWQADRRNLFLCGCLDETTCNNLLASREKIDIHKLANQWEKHDIKICSFADVEYPALLRHIFNPPMIIYYRGRLPVTENLIALVGSRRASAYGKNAAKMLAADLAAAGVWVVSGGARGIDSAAHQGAILTGHTIAVLGCGVDVVYPPENAKLLASITEKGCIISEYAPGTPPHASHFPARNRIINGVARGVIVVEAAEKSGALITADFALEEGRDVFAVPGSIFSDCSKGTHRLIKQGAKLIDSASDIFNEYSLMHENELYPALTLTSEEAAVYDILAYDNPMGIEEIVQQAKLISSTVTYILLQLELRGLVTECGGQSYVRAVREGIR